MCLDNYYLCRNRSKYMQEEYNGRVYTYVVPDDLLWALIEAHPLVGLVSEMQGKDDDGRDVVKYRDYELRALMGAGRISIDGIRVERISYESPLVEFGVDEPDIDYLGLNVFFRCFYEGRRCDYGYFSLHPRRDGSPSDWERFFDGVDCDDAIVRFSFGERKLEPLWIAVLDGDWVYLGGERIDWYAYQCEMRAICDELNEDLRDDGYDPDWGYGGLYDAYEGDLYNYIVNQT